ncbi:MAG: phosphotransferase, partial [Candidatus Binatia bacterium]
LSPSRIRRFMRNLGLSPTGLYWVRPDLINPQAYIPLDIQGTLGWYLRSVFTAPTAAVRLLETGLHILAKFGHHPFAALAPCYALTAVAGPAGDASPSLLGHPALPSELRRSDLHPLVITHGKEDFRRVTVLPFAPDSDGPLAVLKLSRLPVYNDCTENEQAILTRIHASVDETMRRTIPRPLGIIRSGKLAIGVESCAPGRSVANATTRWAVPLRRKIDDLRLGASWLAEFNSRVQIKRSQWADSDLDEWVEKPLGAYEQTFGVTSGEERLFIATRERASSLIGLPLPTVWVHWDFSEENVFRAGRGITVIDWESGAPGPPLLDLLFFTTHWNYSARSLNSDAARLYAFRQLFCNSHRSDPASVAVREAIAEYMARLNIDNRFFPLLLVLVWVVRALGRFPWQPGRSKNARAGNRFVGYLGALAEDVERLFTST